MNTRINDRHRATGTDNQEIQAIRTALDTWDDTTDHHIINEDRIRDDLTALLEERSALLEAIEYWRRQANDTAFRCNELWAVLTQHKRERRLRGKTTTDPEELDRLLVPSGTVILDAEGTAFQSKLVTHGIRADDEEDWDFNAWTNCDDGGFADSTEVLKPGPATILHIQINDHGTSAEEEDQP
jgi:hypothetical protein